MTHAWLDVTCNAGIARIVCMSYRSKTYTWNDVILVKRSMIWVFSILHHEYIELHSSKQSYLSLQFFRGAMLCCLAF